ncbi:Iron-sulfur clusters transporter atm1, mitochondrial [Xylographa carneopallida]|nr:Iron-sulfur clusters transporter atm1, mitochondrial [Xylographa carneopallida]
MILRSLRKQRVLCNQFYGSAIRNARQGLLSYEATRKYTYSATLWQKNISKDTVNIQKTPGSEAAESIKPESVHKNHFTKADEAPKTDALLAEQTVSNKEQRKADWAILKEMARYIWPKAR